MMDSFLAVLLPIPASMTWNKLYWPTMWWLTAIAFCHIGRAHTVGHGDCDHYILESQGYNFDR